MKVRIFECFKVLFGLKRPELDKKDDIYEQFHQTIKALSQRLTVMKHIEKNICEDFALSNGGWFARAVALEIQKDLHNTGKGYLNLHLLHPHCMCDVSVTLIYGDKGRVLAFLNDNESISNLIDKVKILDEKLRHWDE